MNEKAKSNAVLKMITILALIVAIMIPAITGYVVEAEKISTVMTVSGGDVIMVGYANAAGTLNETAINATLTPPYTLDLYEADADTALAAFAGGANMAMVNSVTTVGYNNTVVWNYTDLGLPTADKGDNIRMYIEMDVTTHELAARDFLELKCDLEFIDTWPPTTFNFAYADGTTMRNLPSFIATTNNTYIAVMSVSYKAQLLSAPDENLYLQIYRADPVDDVFTFSLSYNDLSESIWEYDDMTIFDMSIIASIAIMSFIVILNMKDIDVIFRKR